MTERFGRRTFLKTASATGAALAMGGGIGAGRADESVARTTDYALPAQVDAWFRHPVLGDPSFDSFERAPGNPLVTGKAPFEWPVNGFLFEDPQSSNWFAYVGNYCAGYAITPGGFAPHCTVYRSSDRGVSWELLGPIFDDPDFCFEGDISPATHAPDVSILYADGRYHMAYDWATDNTTWETAHAPPDGVDGGAAYAWAEKPEGPWHRATQPILRNSQMAGRLGVPGKYGRGYATTLIRHANDWLAITLVDSGPYFSWGLVAMTAQEPEGEWSEPTLILGIEGDAYFPPIVEGFPGFTHQGFVYAPLTSVARNRNFQALYRAPIKEAHRPDAWELHRNGSAWHAEDVPNEAAGIWGQTFSGFVDADGDQHVLFPSRTKDNKGTINVASRPWSQPLRERGFHLSAHEGRSIALTRQAWGAFDLDAELHLRGTARIVWAYRAPVGPNGNGAGTTLHPLMLTRYDALELTETSWRVLSVDDAGAETESASGALSPTGMRKIGISLDENDRLRIRIDGEERAQAASRVVAGALGLLLEPDTHADVTRFAITGRAERARRPLLYTEALMGAGVNMASWDLREAPEFRFGVGAVRREPGGRAKWNYAGTGFALWAPRGPEFGECEVLLDGVNLGHIDLRSDEAQPSQPVLTHEDVEPGYHAAVVRPVGQERLVIDCLEILG